MRDLTSTQRGTIGGLLFWLAFAMIVVGGTAAYFGFGIIAILGFFALMRD